MNKPLVWGLLAALVIGAGAYATLQHDSITRPDIAAATDAATDTTVAENGDAAAAPVEHHDGHSHAAGEDDHGPGAAPEAAPADKSSALAITGHDIIIGDANAPKTLVEYASLSCSHCASFHTTVLPELKSQLLDTGKAKLVFRHYPLNKPALEGALLVECAAPDMRPQLLKVLFENQGKWAFGSDSKAILKNMALLAGIGNDKFEACQNDEALKNRILQGVKTATDVLKVQSTPTLFVDGKALDTHLTTGGVTKALGE